MNWKVPAVSLSATPMVVMLGSPSVPAEGLESLSFTVWSPSSIVSFFSGMVNVLDVWFAAKDRTVVVGM